MSKTEAWNYSQYKHGCGGTGIVRDASVEHQSCIDDHACGARRVTLGFKWGTLIKQTEAPQSVQARLSGGTVLNPLAGVKILEAQMYDSRGICPNIWLEGLG